LGIIGMFQRATLLIVCTNLDSPHHPRRPHNRLCRLGSEWYVLSSQVEGCDVKICY
jgi:hypothetical protein